MKAVAKVLALDPSAVVLAGCQFGGLNSLDMPGTQGHGAGSYQITVQLPDVATLPQNSPVMVHDVTVGSVIASPAPVIVLSQLRRFMSCSLAGISANLGDCGSGGKDGNAVGQRCIHSGELSNTAFHSCCDAVCASA